MRAHTLEIIITVPGLDFAEYVTLRTSVINWINSKPAGSHKKIMHSENSDTKVIISLYPVISSMADAGNTINEIESALEDFPEGTMPDYIYRQREES